MFGNNPFLTKKDPLIEAVNEARKDGDFRRQAESIVNEQFGVYSRKAVIREHLSAYDAALESTYTSLKEGKWEGSKEDKAEDAKLAKKHGMTMAQWEKSAADKKHDAKEKKMDEAKKADKDYDKDGKIESPKDEVWGSRLRAAKLAGKLKEGAVDAGSMEGSKSVTKSAPKEDPSLPKSYPGAASSAPTAARLSNAKAAVTPVKENVTAPKDWSEKRHPNKNAVVKAPVPGVSIAEAKYSAKAARAGEDIGKPGKQFSKIAKKAGEKYGSEERGKKVAGAILAKIRAKHMKEDQGF